MTPKSPYYRLAKIALQLSSLVLVSTMTACIVLCGLTGDKAFVPMVISSASGLSGICLGVMSYHLRLMPE
jgi:hypothetical protein